MKRLLALLTAVLALTACGSDDGGVEVDEEGSKELETALKELIETSGERPLKELASGDWDTVYIINGPVTGNRASKLIGQRVVLDGYGTYDDALMVEGSLLVLLADREVERMLLTGAWKALGEGRFSSDVILKAEDRAIKVVNPDGSVPKQGKVWSVPESGER